MKSKIMVKFVTTVLVSCMAQTIVNAQVKPVANITVQKKVFLNPKIQPKSTQNSQQRVALLNSFKFKGKTAVDKSSNAGAVNASYKTVRNGRTVEVLPNDGSLGITQNEGRNSSTSDNGALCNTQQVTLTAGFSELNILDPSAAEIWPGRIINMETMDEGSYQSFTDFTRRNDLQIMMTSAGTATGNVIRTIPGNNINQGTVLNQINSIKNGFGNNPFGSQGWMFEEIEYNSMEQFSIEAGLGVSASPINLDIRANSVIGNGIKKNKIVIKFLREALTIKVNNDLSEIVVAENIATKAGLIAAVTYGSFGIIEIESDSSYSAISATLNAAFQANPGVAIDANMTLKQKKTMQNMSIKGIFKGIDGNQSIRNNLSLDGVRRIVTNDADDFKATTPVVPISFSIKSLKTGETMMLRSTLTYPRKDCTPLPPAAVDMRVKIKMMAFTCPEVNDGVSSDEDIYGNIKVTNGSTSKTVWTKNLANNVKVKNSEFPDKAGAYSLHGSAEDFSFIMKTDETSLNTNEVTVRVELFDEEWNKGVPYEIKTIKIKHRDIFRAIKSPATFEGAIDWDITAKMFKIITNERGNTNKIVTWFKVIQD